MKALIKVGYGCNDHCTFCHTLDVRHVDDAAERIDAKIDRAAALGYSMVVLSGGEPTIRPELLQWAKRVASRGLDFGLVTNGRALAYPELVDKLVDCRLKYVYLSMHGGTAKVHDAVVRSHAFAETFGAVENLSGRGLDVTVNCVVNRANLRHLRGVVDRMLPLSDIRLKFSMTEPKGGGWKLFDVVVPKVSEVAGAVADAIAYGEAKDPGRRIFHDGIPLCLLPGLEDRFDDLKTHRYACMIEVWEDDFHPVDDRNKVQPPPCEGCGLRGPCAGLFKAYYERHGADEVRPRPALRSNAFNLVPMATVPWRRGEACPIRGAVTPYDRARTLFLRNGERMTLFRTDTRDFCDTELEAIKLRHGQLYVDTSEKDAPDDFAADLRKIVRLEACETCPEVAACTGCYRVVAGDVFGRDDAFVRRRLSALGGDVLDVGCGEAPYEDVLRPLSEAGAIRYRGMDPDAEALARLRARWPSATLEVGRAEDLELAPGSVDHVLLLRSYNHLERPESVLPRLAAALKPGGTLLIADNVAFGLLRTPRQSKRAEGGPSRFEHYRNDSAEEAARHLEGTDLELLERHDVSPETSNQWMLYYGRREEDRC
jgi:MoaA/NifB/PqqE/SkfB family radical SAM enzyme/SAM-dependent methyltransferase